MPEPVEKFVAVRKTQKEKEQLYQQMQVAIAERLAERDVEGEPLNIDF